MKAGRVLLIAVAGVVVLLLAAVAIAFNASFQTWAARRALASQPDLHGSLGRLSAGLGTVEVRDVRINAHGAVLTLPALDADLPLLAAGLNKRVAVSRLVAKGWTLDLTKAANVAALMPRADWMVSAAPRAPRAHAFSLLPSAYAADPAAASAATAVFRGIFAELKLPVDLSLDGVELQGEVILPAMAGHPASRATLTLRGGGLAAGREGTFVVDFASAQPDGGALTLHSTLAATMDTPRTFTKLGAKLEASASGRQFPQGVKLNATVSAARTAGGESYVLGLVGDGGKPLAAVQADLVSATGRIAGTWKLDLHDGDVAPFALGVKLPAFAAAGEGKLETSLSFDEVHASGQLTASADHLAAVRPELAAIGGVKLVADFDMLHHGRALRVERLDASVAGAAPIVNVRALQPFEFNLATAELRVADPAQDLVGIAIAGVPLAWAAPVLGDLAVSGGDLRGELAMSARDGGLTLRVKSPLTVNGVSVAKAGQPLLRNLDVTINAAADYTPQGWQAQVTELAVRSGATSLLTLDAKAGRLAGKDPAIKAAGHWSANLPGWIAQPALAGQLQLASGQAQGDFTASIDGTKAIEAKIALANLVASTQEKLPAVNLQVRADIAPDGKIVFNAPIVFDTGTRKSDLLAAGSVTPGGAAMHVDARVSSETIFVEDVQMLALLLPPSQTAAPAADRPAGTDKKAFWSAVEGQLTLALKKVVYRGQFEVANVGGTLRLDPAALKLENVRAAFGADSDVKVDGAMKFDAKAAAPYALDADVALNNFDTAPAFRALDPTKPPTVEGRVDVAGHFVGGGVNVAEVAERARGDLQVTGRSGVFRALSADLTNKVQKTQSTVAAIGGILGAVTGKKEYADYANKTEILSDITKALAEIPFDQLNVTATRDADLNMVLKDFTLISPEVRLTGGGQIKHVEGTPLLGQPLSVQMNLGARGRLADLLKRAGLLEAKQDNLGYAAFVTPIKIGGTLAKTDTSELRNALLNSVLVKGGLLDPILGK